MTTSQPFRAAPCRLDLIDLAILGVFVDGTRAPQAVVDVVRALCRPWLHPTGETVTVRLARHAGAGLVSQDGQALRLTAAGAQALRWLVVAPAGAWAADHRELAESLRLALAVRLAQAERDLVHADLLRDRVRCVAAARRRQRRAAGSGGVLGRAVGHAVALAEMRLGALRTLLAESDSPAGPLARSMETGA